MKPSLNSGFPTLFQQIFAFFCVLMTEIWFFLFSHNLASKLCSLLITIYIRFLPSLPTSLRVQWGGVGGGVTNRIQREFLFNDAIASQELVSYSRLFAKLTNLLKQFVLSSPLQVSLRTLWTGRGVLSLCAAERVRFRAAEKGLEMADTNFSKRTLIQMSLYGHLRRAVTSRRRHRPRTTCAKKQTFPNLLSVSPFL
jgi:hypothetical protein